METPWGDLELCDAHAHLFSWNFFRVLAEQKGIPAADRPVEAVVGELGWDLPPARTEELALQWVQELDRKGVERIVLMASVPGDEDSAAVAVRAYPERIFGYFMLNPLAADAAERAVRAVDVLGLRGICLFPAMHRFSLQDERLRPIYEIAAGRPGMVVFVHMGVLSVGVRKKLGLASRFDMSMSNPIDLHAVALEFPTVNFVIPHFGAGYFREILMLGDLAPNVHLDTSSSNAWTKYQSPVPSLKDVFAQALAIYGPRRLLFGSDSSFFPRGWNAAVFEEQCSILDQLAVSQGDAAAIFGGNLRRLMATSAD